MVKEEDDFKMELDQINCAIQNKRDDLVNKQEMLKNKEEKIS